jgi:NAD+ synthetase
MMKAFDAEKVRDNLTAQIRKLAEEQGFSRVVVGISGGKDSSVTAALCARALGAENVYGVKLPDGVQSDLEDSRRICEALGIHQRTVNIGAIHDALRAVTDQAGTVAAPGEFEVAPSRAADINVGPRLRMTVLRYLAQALDARLAGTGNLSEATTGYCTKDGDTSCDFAVLGALTSVEVVQLGLSMEELPRELVRKTPTDGLSGKSDEENMGLRYEDIHRYLREGTCGDPETDGRIRKREAAGMHKRRMPPVLDPFEPAEDRPEGDDRA